MRFPDSRSDWLISILAAIMAAVLPATTPVGAQTPTPAATQPAGLTLQQVADMQVQALQSDWLTEIARGLWQPPTATERTQRLYMLDRQVALLRAAVAVFDRNPRANLELSQAADEASGAYQQLARQAQDSANQLAAQAKTAPAEQQRQLTESAERLRRMGDEADRRAGELRATMVEALARYVAQRPADVQAWQSLLRLQMTALQTVNERIDYLNAQLAKLPTTAPETPGQPQVVGLNERRSALLDFLAQYAAAQGDDAKAADYYNRAIAALPLNRGAKQARLIMLKDRGQDKPIDYLDLYLTSFRLNPTDMATVEAIAAFLTRYGIYDLPAAATGTPPAGQADQSFGRGALGWLALEAALYQHFNRDPKTNEPLPVPASLLVLRGRTQLLAGRPDDAAKAARQAIAQTEKGSLLVGANDGAAPLPAIDLPARVLLIEALQASKDKAADDAEINAVVDYYKAHRTKPSLAASADTAGWLSWFYLRILSDAKTAVELGREAFKASPDNPMARLALGAALASGDAAAATEALKVLEPLEGDWPMYYQAKANRTLKSDAKADELLKALATNWPGTPAGQAARAELGAKAPPPPATQPMADMLAELPPGLFNFYRTPGMYAAIDMQLTSGAAPFESVMPALRLSNQTAAGGGKGFAITVGEGLMVWPTVLVSTAVQLPGEQKPRVFSNFCRLNIGSPQVLMPGESMTIVSAVDIGPLQQILRVTPQARKTVTLSMLINPVQDAAGQWSPGPGGYRLEGQFARAELDTSRTAMASLTDAVVRGPAGYRLIADRAVGGLLAEQQLAKQLPYAVRNISTFELSDLLIRSAGDADPQVRAFVPDAVYFAGVSGKLLDAVDNGLSDRDWLVRLMTIRLLGDRMGQTYEKQIRDMAGRDENSLVRGLAQTYVDQWDTQAGKR